MSAYEIYENGYQNGIRFGYIPENLTKKEMQIWAMGYNDAMAKKHRTLKEVKVEIATLNKRED